MSVDSFYTAATPHRFWRQQSFSTSPVYNPPNVAQATPPFVHPMYAAYMHHWYQQQQQLRFVCLSVSLSSILHCMLTCIYVLIRMFPSQTSIDDVVYVKSETLPYLVCLQVNDVCVCNVLGIVLINKCAVNVFLVK